GEYQHIRAATQGRSRRLPLPYLWTEGCVRLNLTVGGNVGRQLVKVSGRLLHSRDVRASRTSLGAIGEEGYPGRIAHQPGAIPGRRQRNLGELDGGRLRHHGAVGEGEYRVVRQNH